MSTNLCPNCGRPMGPGMSFCPPCAAARRRQTTKPAREFNPWLIFLALLLAGAAVLAHRVITVTIPGIKAGRAADVVRTHDIKFTLNRSETHYTVEEVITHYNPQTKLFKPELLTLTKPSDEIVWSAKRDGAAYDVVCRFRGAVYSFKLTGADVQGIDDNGQAVLDQEGAMVDLQPSLPGSSVPPGAL